MLNSGDADADSDDLMNKRLPNLIVPGAMKAGTTSFAAALEQHPDVFLHPFKEPMYFAQTPQSREKLYELLSPDGEEYDTVTPHDSISYIELGEYLAGFSAGEGAAYRLDASTMYLQSPDAIALVRGTAPDAKFIVVLRNPYDRAYSAYQYQRSRLREPAPTFAAAVAHERAGGRDTWMYGWRYIFSSLYAQQIERLMQRVPAGDRLIVLFEDLVAEGGMDNVWGFLGLPSYGLGMVFENETVLLSDPASKVAARFMHNQRLGRAVRGMLPRSAVGPIRAIVAAARKRVYSRGTKPEPMTHGDRSAIADLIEPDITHLEELLQRDLTHWRCSADM